MIPPNASTAPPVHISYRLVYKTQDIVERSDEKSKPATLDDGTENEPKQKCVDMLVILVCHFHVLTDTLLALKPL